MEVLQQAIEGTGGLDQDKLADYFKTHTFKTVAGDIKFGPNGEWAEARSLEVQFQGVQGNGIDQFKTPDTEKILWPPSEKNGTLRIPYSEAQH
jgi:branched-chain amino acid transport system substrate-binding protein